MRALLLVAVAVASVACERRSYSDRMTERATVEDVIFQPSRHGSASGFAVSAKGDVSPTFGSVDIPEKKTVVFRCQHGRFALESDRNEIAAGLWSRLSKGQEVTLVYREVFVGEGSERRRVKVETMEVR